MTLYVTLRFKNNNNKKKSGFSTEFSRLCFFDFLNMGVVITFGLHPAILSSLSYTLWFDRFLQGFKGKLMLFSDACFVLFLIAGIY